MENNLRDAFWTRLGLKLKEGKTWYGILYVSTIGNQA